MDIKKVRVIFIIPQDCRHDSETSESMQTAFKLCHLNAMNIDWVSEEDCSSINLQKTDFLIFQSFEGMSFDNLKESKCARILGPWCLITCLTEGMPIPNVPWPIYNVAMRDCYVTCSTIASKLKKEIKEKIQLMAGHYTDSLVEGNTHLVTDSVKSEKYIKAAQAGMKIMTSEWIGTVWESSLKENTHCNAQQYKVFCVKPFHKLVVCCTGITKVSERQYLEEMINENGGCYKGSLNLRKTDILVCQGDNSEKYAAARKTPLIKCVSVDWVADSIERGYALPESQYPVKKHTSTPTKESSDANPNFSTMSAIASNSVLMQKSCLSETINSTMSVKDFNTPKSDKRKGDLEYVHLLNGLDIKRVKQAGSFLDGCSIYLAGFSAEEREKLCKILNFSGATRYDDLSDRITHCIVGDRHCQELKMIRAKGPLQFPLLTIHWLLESIKQQQPVSEEDYFISTSASPAGQNSPLSKKGLNLLRSNTKVLVRPSPPPKLNLLECDMEPEIDIMQQYLKQGSIDDDDTLARLLQSEQLYAQQSTAPLASNIPSEVTQDSASVTQDESSQVSLIFEGYTFFIGNFCEDEAEQVRTHIEQMSGKVLPESYRGSADFGIVPTFEPFFGQLATEVVNDLWVSECYTEGSMREIMYYHRAISVKATLPLKESVVTISTYTNYERNFLRFLIVQLGGVCQDQFARITALEKNILGSTHLVTPDTSGKKYLAAIKWKLPVVHKEWLLECATTGKLVAEEDYLIGDAIAPKRPPVSREEISSIPISNSSSPVSRKENASLQIPQHPAYEARKSTEQSLAPKTPNRLSPVSRQENASIQIPQHPAYEARKTKEQSLAPKTPNRSSPVSRQENASLEIPQHLAYEASKSTEQSLAHKTPNRSSAVSRQENAWIQTPQHLSHEARKSTEQSLTPNRSSPVNQQEISSMQKPQHPALEACKTDYRFETPKRCNPGSSPMAGTSQDCSPAVYSQITPVKKIMAEVRKNNLLGTPECPTTPKPWDHVDTPDTPLGAFIRPNPSPNLRKEMVRLINRLPEYKPPRPRRLSTPLSELKRQYWNKVCPPKKSDIENYPPQPNFSDERSSSDEIIVDDSPPTPRNTETPDSQDLILNEKLEQLVNVLSASGGAKKSLRRRVSSTIPVQSGSTAIKDSQVGTVGWDYMETDDTNKKGAESAQKQVPNFMISGLSMEERNGIITKLESLGATVTDLANYDPCSTHLVCPKPSRNEKMLSCMAAGKWILHTNYVEHSVANKAFLDEECYEFGNPKSQGNIPVLIDKEMQLRAQAIYSWRKDIMKREYGAFHDMRAIVIAKKRDPIVTVIEAGGGMVVNVSPPYEDTIYATHCLLEAKSVTNFAEYSPLARQGIHCVSTLYINEFLHRTAGDVRDSILPYFSKYSFRS